MNNLTKQIAIFASGNGSTLQAIIDEVNSKKINLKITLVVSDVKDAYALKRAKDAGIDTYIIKATNKLDIDCELEKVLKEYNLDLIVLAGYLRMIDPKLLKNYTIINTHPSLLPKYGGRGMFGMNVHKAVVENKETQTGVTVHFVDDKYDHGNIISQTIVPVFEADTPEDVSIRVQIAEKKQLISVLKDFSEGKL